MIGERSVNGRRNHWVHEPAEPAFVVQLGEHCGSKLSLLLTDNARAAEGLIRTSEMVGSDELEEHALELRSRLLRQVKQRCRRSSGRYRVRMQAATTRRGRARRWLLLSDKTGGVGRAGGDLDR